MKTRPTPQPELPVMGPNGRMQLPENLCWVTDCLAPVSIEDELGLCASCREKMRSW